MASITPAPSFNDLVDAYRLAKTCAETSGYLAAASKRNHSSAKSNYITSVALTRWWQQQLLVESIEAKKALL